MYLQAAPPCSCFHGRSISILITSGGYVTTAIRIVTQYFTTFGDEGDEGDEGDSVEANDFSV